MIQCLFLVSRQGKTRLTKWYNQSLTTREKQRFLKEVLDYSNIGKFISVDTRPKDVQFFGIHRIQNCL